MNASHAFNAGPDNCRQGPNGPLYASLKARFASG